MSAPETISFSIIIPTRDRKDSLRRCLTSLEDLDYPHDRLEVVVVDDGSTDGTAEMVAGMRAALTWRLLYLRGEKTGIPAARNTGARASSGEVLVFSDDDCTFPADWLAVIAGQLRIRNLGAVGMRDRLPAGGALFSRCVDYTVNSLVGAGGVRCKEGPRLGKYYPRGFGMAVPRRVIEEVGLFDESLSAGEDIDLSCRIAKAGYVLAYAPETFVWHERRATVPAFIKQMFIRGWTRVQLIRRHGALLEPAYLLPGAVLFFGGVLLVGAFFSPAVLKALVVGGAFYAVVLGLSGVKGAVHMKDARAALLIPLVTLIQHCMYGAGLIGALGGLVGEKVARRERPVPGERDA